MSRSLTRRGFVVAGVSVALAVTGAVPAVGGPPAGQGPGRGWVESTLHRMTLEEKVGQLFVQYAYGSTADTRDSRNVSLYGVETPAEVVQKYHLGGVIYFNWTDSAINPRQILDLSNGLQRAALTQPSKVHIPLTIATDQEQGVVYRVGPPATQFPGSMAIGASRNPAYARTAAGITGQELRAIGINTDFAPDADVNVNPLNPVIGVRSFSSDPQLTAQLVGAQVEGYQRDGNISATAKHFPGHGDTDTDSHTGIPYITHTREQWEQVDAPPFRAAVDSGIDMIMTAHIVVESLDPSGDPATLSKPIMTGILRKELGFKGVVITDSLGMQGVREKYGDDEVAVRALEAGVDQLLMPPDMDTAWNAVLEAVKSGRISTKDLDAKVRRILTLKVKRGIVDRPYADPAGLDRVVGTPEHLAAADEVTEHTATLVKNDDDVLPLAVDDKRLLVTGYGVTTTATLGDALADQGADVEVRETGASPTDDAVADAVEAAAEKDAVVVTTMKAWDTEVTDKRAGQQKLVKALVDTGTTVIVVAVRDPYDIAYFDDAPTYIATYSYNPVAMQALAKVITGEVNPSGKLPVDIPVAGDPTTVLYPFGAGLGY